jgi:DNA (cytosine-5)-methyltransferase 1
MKKLRVLDLFSGAGGSSYGALLAGAEIIAGVDAWKIASDTYQYNFKNSTSFNIKLESEITNEKILNLKNIDILLASPECTNHTYARGSKPICENSRMTAWQVIYYAQKLNPKYIVIENVIQMQSWNKFNEFIKDICNLGYLISFHILNSSDFGVPQSRKRLFIIASKNHKIQIKNIDYPIINVRSIIDPENTWKTTLLYNNKRAKPTIERAERGFQELGNNEPFLLVYYSLDGSGGWQTLDRPLRTLTTVDRFALVTPSKDGPKIRMLQVPELKRAMGFDDNFKLPYGTHRDKVKLLGNGVCPPVMKHIIESIQQYEN